MRVHRFLIGAIIASFVACTATGCATMTGLKNTPLAEGELRLYTVKADSLVLAARNALVAADLRIDEITHPEPGLTVLYAYRESGDWTVGEIIRIVVNDTDDDGRTKVRIIGRRRGALQFTAKGNWPETLFSAIEAEVDPLGQHRVVIP